MLDSTIRGLVTRAVTGLGPCGARHVRASG